MMTKANFALLPWYQSFVLLDRSERSWTNTPRSLALVVSHVRLHSHRAKYHVV